MMRIAVLVPAFLLATSCMVGPNYKRPSASTPPAFKEQPPVNFKEAEAAGWKQSQPADAYLKGRWWEIYRDPALNALEEQVAISNQNVLTAEAQYREAHALVGVARSSLFPVVSLGASSTTAGRGPVGGSSSLASIGAGTGSSSGTRTTYSLPLSVSWEPDIWGSIHRGITASGRTAQAAAADLENAKLLYQAELAQDYFGLHGVDAEIDLLQRTESSYTDYLKLTRQRFTSGVASDLDVAQAETQLYDAQSSLTDTGVPRAQYEHAIAVLTGKAPAEVAIPSAILKTDPPAVPIGVPSELLERRPDIASAERRVAAANEQIGIAIAAFYPTFTIGGSLGFSGSSITKWLTWPSRVWSVGPQFADTLFDAGRRRSIVAEQRAAYDATVAEYRQTTLAAMQQVEDNLAALRILEQESATVQQSVAAAERELSISTAQYRAGTQSYLQVITSQATLLGAQRSLVDLQTRRLTASVLLIDALGGGWDASKLPRN